MIDIIGFISGEVSLDTDQKVALLDDFCSQYGYQEEIEGEPNPVSKKDFANSKITNYIKETVNAYRKTEAEKATSFTELDI